MGRVMRGLITTLICAGALALAGPGAQAGDDRGPVSKTVSVRSNGDGPATERVVLGLNKAAIIELPADAADVLVSNPTIVDAIVRTPRRIYILGLAVGQTNAFFFSGSGKQLLNLEIRVERDMVALDDLIAKHFPKLDVQVESINDNIVLTGTVPSASLAEQVKDIAVRYIGAPEKVLNLLNVSGREQVLIRVRVAEMQRVVAKQLGIDLSALAVAGGVPISFESINKFSLLGTQLGSPNGLGVGALPDPDFSNGVTGLPDGYNNLAGTLRALERANVMKLLAEPNLTALSGETANFMAGGQFPVPTGSDDNGNVSIQFKPFGVGLAFTPVVLSEGRISLKISSEVSELTSENALVLPGNTIRTNDGNLITSQPITIPGLRVRRAESTVEMPSGGSMMIAGLLRDDVKQAIDGYPGLKDVPVLGALFRSRDFQSNQTELVVIVSAVLVDPVSGHEMAAPTDGFVPANDAQAYLNGQVNATHVTPTASAAAKRGGGYILE
jgi:pilus assembly protein CpaC